MIYLEKEQTEKNRILVTKPGGHRFVSFIKALFAPERGLVEFENLPRALGSTDVTLDHDLPLLERFRFGSGSPQLFGAFSFG